MKRILYLVILVPLIAWAGTGKKSKAEVKADFVKACIDGGEHQMPDDSTKKVFRAYCACAGDAVIAKFSDRELQEIDRMQAPDADTTGQGRVQEKLLKVIQPCLDEMQAKLMEMQQEK